MPSKPPSRLGRTGYKTKRERKPKVVFVRWAKNVWAKATHNWTWFASVATAAVVGPLCYLLGQANFFGLTMAEALEFNYTWLVLFTKIMASVLFFNRTWFIAKYPRPASSKVNWMRLDWKQMIVIFTRDNYVAVIAGALALIFAFSAAPEGLAIFESIKPE